MTNFRKGLKESNVFMFSRTGDVLARCYRTDLFLLHFVITTTHKKVIIYFELTFKSNLYNLTNRFITCVFHDFFILSYIFIIIIILLNAKTINSYFFLMCFFILFMCSMDLRRLFKSYRDPFCSLMCMYVYVYLQNLQI